MTICFTYIRTYKLRDCIETIAVRAGWLGGQLLNKIGQNQNFSGTENELFEQIRIFGAVQRIILAG